MEYVRQGWGERRTPLHSKGTAAMLPGQAAVRTEGRLGQTYFFIFSREAGNLSFYTKVLKF